MACTAARAVAYSMAFAAVAGTAAVAIASDTGTGTLPVYADGSARLEALLAGSLEVTIPPGVYLIDRELDVRDGHMISAATSGAVILKAADHYGGRIISARDERITVRDVTFDGNYVKRSALEGRVEASLVSISGASAVSLENNRFQYAPSFGIWSYRSAQLQIRGNTFLENYQAIRIDGHDLESGVIENNTFKNTTAFKSRQHIEGIWTRKLVVRGNTMMGAGLAAPTSPGYAGTWGNSIYLAGSTGYVIENNQIDKNHWSAIVSGSGTTHGVIRNNKMRAGDTTAIAVWVEQAGANDITLDGNEVDGGLFVGDNGGDNLTITNNVVRSRGVGIDVSFATRTALIQGNRFYSTSGLRDENGMYLWKKEDPATNVRVIGNHFEGFNRGIAVNNAGGVGTVYGISLSGNTFANNNQDIWVPSGIRLNQSLGQ